MPLLFLVLFGVAAYAAVKVAGSSLLTSAKSLGQGLAQSTGAQPSTGPQAMSRDQKVAFFKLLPNLVVVEDASAQTFDSGVLQPAAQQISSSQKSAPSLDVVYNASMSGHAVLVARHGTDTMILVPAVGTENGFAKPGSDWFIVLNPNEADAIATAAGVDVSSVKSGGKIAPSGSGGGKLSILPGSGSSKSSFVPVAGNPFRKLGSAFVNVAKGIAASLSPSTMDLSMVPGSDGDGARAAVAANDAGNMVTWADQLATDGYTTAAKQLYDLARGQGWAPIDSDTVHYPLMTLDEIKAQLDTTVPEHPTYTVRRLAMTMIGKKEGDMTKGDWSNTMQWMYDKFAARERAIANNYEPSDAATLMTGSDYFGRAGYTEASNELAAVAKAIGG